MAKRDSLGADGGQMWKGDDSKLDVAAVLESLFDSVNADSTTGALKTVEYAHAEIHAGDHFYNKGGIDLSNGQTYVLIIAVANTTKWPHFLFEIWHELELSIVITKGVTTGADGTALASFNRNHNSDTVPGMIITHTPTSPTGGTVCWSYHRGAGNKAGGEIRATNEMVLDQGVKYQMDITNEVVNNNLVDWLFDWYEHTNE